MSSSNCCFLICIRISQEAGKVVWYSHIFQNFPQFVVIHTVKGFGIINKIEIHAFLEISCFFYDLMDVGNLIPSSSAFSKSSLYVWKSLVHILLKSSLKAFEHDLASMWNECNCMIVWTFFVIVLWGWNENDLYQSRGHWWVIQICWYIKYNTFRASSFRIWNSWTRIP